MDDEVHEDKPLPSLIKSSSRHRSPTFSRDEVRVLLDLVDKYKVFILNKSITSAASQAKDAAWVKVAKAFNSHNFGVVRSSDSLKTKWENLKRDARKLSKDIMGTKSSEFNDLVPQVVTLMCEAGNIGPIDNPKDLSGIDISEDGSEDNKDLTNNSERFWDESVDKQSDDDHHPQEDDDNEGNERNRRINRSLNFSPRECTLLLQCVKKEKKLLFSKDVTSKAIELKNHAWSRVTNSYNKLSPQKRSTKVLRTKFCNMKNLARKVGFKSKDKSHKHEKKIKQESIFEYKVGLESDLNEEVNDDIIDDFECDNYVNLVPDRPDPLSSVLNGDSGIGSIHMGTCNQSENKEVVKLKMEILNYRMETAKLERQRVENAIKEDAAARVSRELESAFRLRAARLDAVTAEMKLPLSHPALHYTPEEDRVRQYLSQYHGTEQISPIIMIVDRLAFGHCYI